MRTNKELAQLLAATFNVNKVWDFIESKPFYNKQYMPMFETAKDIWDSWRSEEKNLYSKFKWKDKHGGKVHPREIENQRRQGNYKNLAGVNKSKQEIAQLLATMEPKTAYGDMVYSSMNLLEGAAKKLVKPENYSVLKSKTGGKFMLTTNKRASQFEKAGEWTRIGKIDPKGVYRNNSDSNFAAADFANPKFDESVVKEVKKQLKSLTPQLLKATGNKMNFTTFNLPKDGGQVRVSVHVEDGPNEDAGSINTTVRANGAGLLSDKNMYAYVEPLKPSQRMGGEFYHMAVTIFKNK